MYLECTCIWFGDLKLSTPPLLKSYENFPTYTGHPAGIECLNANTFASRSKKDFTLLSWLSKWELSQLTSSFLL